MVSLSEPNLHLARFSASLQHENEVVVAACVTVAQWSQNLSDIPKGMELLRAPVRQHQLCEEHA